MIDTVRPLATSNAASTGNMSLRRTAASVLDVQGQFRKTIGYSDLGKLAVARLA